MKGLGSMNNLWNNPVSVRPRNKMNLMQRRGLANAGQRQKRKLRSIKASVNNSHDRDGWQPAAIAKLERGCVWRWRPGADVLEGEGVSAGRLGAGFPSCVVPCRWIVPHVSSRWQRLPMPPHAAPPH